MSGIFGFINLDGRPASPESFQKMADEMSGWGPDGVGSILSGSAAFGHALLIVTHESRFEKMPIHDQDEGILFTAAARLDNRDELCDLFGIPHPERPVTSDGQLVFRAFKKWGTESCKHIFGDWSFSAWHIKEQRLFLARDHLGNTGLYYYFKPPLIVFASNVKAILVHPEVPRELNEMHLAQRMVYDYSDETFFQTYWMDVCSLPASHWVTFTGKGEQVEKYWQLDEAPPIRFGSDNEYLEGFLDQFRRAVRVRLNSVRPIGTQLSAGLDSSSVTALAAEALIETNQPLIAYTSVPFHQIDNNSPNRLIDEWPLAHKVAEFYMNIEHIPIRSEDISPLVAVKQSLNMLHEPQYGATNILWIISMFEKSKRSNIGVMLTGQLGNGGISWSGGQNYIFYLFAQKEWRKGTRALNAWKERNGHSWFRAVKSQLLRPVLLPLWPKYQHFFHPEKKTNFSYPFPNKAFVNRMRLNKEDHLADLTKPLPPLAERMLTLIRGGSLVGPFWQALGSFFKMEVRDPTSDVRLLEFCIGIPNEQNTFDGGKRMLIRRAMTGILPDSVRWNTLRGRQSADILERLIVHQDDMEKALTRFESAPEVTKYIDISDMKNDWISIRTGQSMHSTHAITLMRAMNVAYFILSLQKNKRKLDFINGNVDLFVDNS
jgi:asparagine synthase (glutamine-hydrolysing)